MKNENGKNFERAVEFWEDEERLRDIKEYFGGSPGTIYGLDANPLAHVLGTILKSLGFYNIKHSDIIINQNNQITGFDPKQIDGENILAIRDGAITPGDIAFARRIKEVENQGVHAKSAKYIHTSPKYDMMNLENLLMHNYG